MNDENLGRNMLLGILILGILVALVIMIWTHATVIGPVCLANGSIPAYHVLQPRDIRTSSMLDVWWQNGTPAYISLLLGGGSFTDNTSIEGKYYTLAPVNDSRVITGKTLHKLPDSVGNDSNLSQNRYKVIGIPATSTMIPGNALCSGDRIDFWFIPGDANLTPVSYNGLLVMDILRSADNNASEPYLLVLALNQSDVDGFYRCMNNSSLIKVITRNLTARGQ